MQTDHLHTFITVAQYKSFSKAAKVLNLSQPAVSHQIHLLETHFDTQLFERSHRKISLTESGRILLKHAQEIIQINNKIQLSIVSAKQKSITKIGCSNTIGENLVSKYIQDFSSSQKQISADRFQIIVGTSNEMADKLYNEEIDIAMVEGQEKKYPFFIEPFYDDEVVIVSSPDHPVASMSSEDCDLLKEATWLMREPGCSLRNATLNYWTAFGISPESVLIFNNNQLIKEGVKNGIGIAAFSKTAVSKELERGELIDKSFCDTVESRPFFLMRKKATFPSDLSKKFWNHVVATKHENSLPH